MDADIKNHGDIIRPPGSQKKKKPQPAPQPFGQEDDDKGDGEYEPQIIRESDPDPYGMLENQEMPEMIPGLFHHASEHVPATGKNTKKSKRKQKNQDDNVVGRDDYNHGNTNNIPMSKKISLGGL